VAEGLRVRQCEPEPGAAHAAAALYINQSEQC